MKRARGLGRDTRGGVIVEYTVLLGLVGVASLAVLLAIGTSLAQSFDASRAYVLTPVP